jgi:hypothetical protein
MSIEKQEPDHIICSDGMSEQDIADFCEDLLEEESE